MTHTWAVCAYKESPYLETCINSLIAQSIKSDIAIFTSTPNQYIEGIAKKYDIPLYIRDGESSISKDWNFAYNSVNTDMVTIAHQDDVYEHDYLKTVMENKNKFPDMSLFTCASVTIKRGRLMKPGVVEIVKCILRLPLRLKKLSHLFFIKRSAVIFGNPIICPANTYDKGLCGKNLFDSPYSFVLDWDILLKLSKTPGRWICIEKPYIMYRVHNASETKKCICDNTRENEELEIFRKIWPDCIVKHIIKFYKKSYDAYK